MMKHWKRMPLNKLKVGTQFKYHSQIYIIRQNDTKGIMAEKQQALSTDEIEAILFGSKSQESLRVMAWVNKE